MRPNLIRLPHGCLLVFDGIVGANLPSLQKTLKLCAEYLTDTTVDKHAQQTLRAFESGDLQFPWDDFTEAELWTAMLDRWKESELRGASLVN